MSERLTILAGHVLDKLKELPDNSVHCVVTSPPYYGLRNYGIAPQIWGGQPDCQHDFSVPAGKIHKGGPQGDGGDRIGRDTSAQNDAQDIRCGDYCCRCGAWRGDLGLEPTLELYIAHMVEVFREVRRVLRDDGTLWLNLGDSYASNGGHVDTTCNDRRGEYRIGARPEHDQRFRAGAGFKPKDLMMTPSRVAIALQADGWYLRCDIVWDKPNPMPESCTDRPTKSHEYIFLMSKSERYFYDAEAIKEKSSPDSHARYSRNRSDNHKYADGGPGNQTIAKSFEHMKRKAGIKAEGVKANKQWWDSHEGMMMTRNKRSVWRVTTKAFKDAHFATFPPDLILPCILAGTSAHGCCQICEAPFERVIEDGPPNLEHQRACGGDANGDYFGQSTKDYDKHLAQDASATKARILKGMVTKKTVDWKKTCDCPKDLPPMPCRVLDPFGGSFTTAMVAIEHGRHAIVCELKPEYIEMGKRRCDVTSGLPL